MRTPLIVAAVAFSQMGATDCGQVVKDPGFDLWCGDSLCAWKTERGSVERVPTWNAGDSGVQLDGSDAAIEQFTSFNSGDGTCVTFDLVANVDDQSEVYFNVDVEGDGTLEMHERIPTSHYQSFSYTLAFAAPFDGVRFELAKTGNGTTVFANLGVTTVDKSMCAGITPLDPGPRKNGAACATHADCASDICELAAIPGTIFGIGQVCMGCDPNTANSCGATMSCGINDPVSPILQPPIACEPLHGRELGELCLTGADCASSICNKPANESGVCSSCSATVACATGDTCRQAWTSTDAMTGAVTPIGPETCSSGKTGEACAADGDCTSGHCNGAARMQCFDGRPCATRDDCPIDGNLTPGACTTVGIQGGSCE